MVDVLLKVTVPFGKQIPFGNTKSTTGNGRIKISFVNTALRQPLLVSTNNVTVYFPATV